MQRKWSEEQIFAAGHVFRHDLHTAHVFSYVVDGMVQLNACGEIVRSVVGVATTVSTIGLDHYRVMPNCFYGTSHGGILS
jgi:hypothetical protein